MEFYRKKLDEDLDIKDICDSDLENISIQVLRNLLYNDLMFGKDITYDMFIENLNIYLNMIDRI